VTTAVAGTGGSKAARLAVVGATDANSTRCSAARAA
jgi:hypothetical protein